MTKRYRTLKAKPGELRAYYGLADGDGPDVCYAWGDGVAKADGRLLHGILSCDRMMLDFPNIGHKYGPSFLKELEERGYDITTLRFSIQKKSRADITTAEQK